MSRIGYLRSCQVLKMPCSTKLLLVMGLKNKYI